MEKRQARVTRQGRIYRFTVNGTDYAAFVWKMGKLFCGRVEDSPQVPHCTARTEIAVCDALRTWIVTSETQ